MINIEQSYELQEVAPRYKKIICQFKIGTSIFRFESEYLPLELKVTEEQAKEIIRAYYHKVINELDLNPAITTNILVPGKFNQWDAQKSISVDFDK